MATTLGLTWLGAGLGLDADSVQGSQIRYVALTLLAVLMLNRLAAASRATA